MYSQGLIGADGKTHEDEAFLNAFQARIDAEQKIEPNDPMPEGYRKTLVRQIRSMPIRKSLACNRKATG